MCVRERITAENFLLALLHTAEHRGHFSQWSDMFRACRCDEPTVRQMPQVSSPECLRRYLRLLDVFTVL